VRIIYFYRSHRGTIHFMAIYAKSQQEDLAPADKAVLRDLVKVIEEHQR